MDYLQLIQRITGDRYWGRAVRECQNAICDDGYVGYPKYRTFTVCDTCNGNGVVFREWRECPECDGGKRRMGHPSGQPSCSRCNGERRVPDTEGREIIAEAVTQWAYALSNRERLDWLNSVLASSRRSSLSMWDMRDGTEWQSALEAHVRDYQRPLPDLTTPEGCEWLKARLREIPIWYELVHSPFKPPLHRASVYQHVGINAGGPTEPAALLAACEAAFVEERA